MRSLQSSRTMQTGSINLTNVLPIPIADLKLKSILQQLVLDLRTVANLDAATTIAINGCYWNPEPLFSDRRSTALWKGELPIDQTYCTFRLAPRHQVAWALKFFVQTVGCVDWERARLSIWGMVRKLCRKPIYSLHYTDVFFLSFRTHQLRRCPKTIPQI